jgi:hypothetical protein
MQTKENVAKFMLVIINYSDSDLAEKLTCLSFEIVYSTENGKVVRLKMRVCAQTPLLRRFHLYVSKGGNNFNYLALFQGLLSCKWDSTFCGWLINQYIYKCFEGG